MLCNVSFPSLSLCSSLFPASISVPRPSNFSNIFFWSFFLVVMFLTHVFLSFMSIYISVSLEPPWPSACWLPGDLAIDLYTRNHQQNILYYYFSHQYQYILIQYLQCLFRHWIRSFSGFSGNIFIAGLLNLFLSGLNFFLHNFQPLVSFWSLHVNWAHQVDEAKTFFLSVLKCAQKCYVDWFLKSESARMLGKAPKKKRFF